MQKLLFPFKQAKMICGYKNHAYRYGDGHYRGWGYDHYGVDISGRKVNANYNKIFASGEGLVLVTGRDNSGGNIVIIQYNDVYNHKTKEVYNLIARYYHLNEILVAVGEKVTPSTIIGTEGNTATKQPHLHLEFDKDIKNPTYSPQVSSRDDHKSIAEGNILHHGYTDSRDTTVNPSFILHQTNDRKVTWIDYNDVQINDEDRSIPFIVQEECTENINELKKEVKNLKAQLDIEITKKNKFLNELKKLIKRFEEVNG